MMTLSQVIEALVFASPKPLAVNEIVAALRGAGEASEDEEARAFSALKEAEIANALVEIQTELGASGRAFRLVEQARGWTFVSDPACAQWVRQLYPEAKPTRLTGPQLETLAIVAYRQPVTRADIEAVRGVAVDGVMQILLDRSLVKIVGRAEVPGRPLLYETTEYFLQHFGLKTIDELPNSTELKRVALPKAAVPVEAKPEATAPKLPMPEAPTAEAAAPASEPDNSPPPAEDAPPSPPPEPA